MNDQLFNKLIEDSKVLASRLGHSRGVCGDVYWRALCDKALITVVVQDIISIIGPIAGSQSEIKHRYGVE